jgi:secreted trypsin-like serine protease
VQKNTQFNCNFFQGTSACNGDSGGGFVIEKEKKWFIRGIVSLGVVKNIYNGGGEYVTRVCNENFPSLYTDLAGSMQWIAQNVPDINIRFNVVH